MMKKYILYFLLLPGLFAIGTLQSCNLSKSARADKAVMQAEKPAVDSSKIIPLMDLYRARRYEDLQTALAAGPEKVYKLTFHGKKIGALSSEIAHFPYLATLDVAFNDLTDLPEELASLHYLQGFYANGNKLTSFPGQLILLPLLERVNLADNQVPEIPGEIVRMDQLTSLNLEKNQIMSLPVQVFELENLGVLNLSGNGLSEVPEGISALASLKKLDLSHNQLSAIPREVATMGKHLSELMVQGNQIPREEIDWFIEAMPTTKIRF